MSDTTLQDRFLALYPRLRERLARRLGSRDAAEDALQDAFLKLARVSDGASIRDPQGYLMRVAVNAASDQRRAGARLASAAEIDAAMEIADPLADPGRTLEGQDAIDRLSRAVESLTPRRRAILEAARIHGRSCREIAAEMGLSRRTVELELRHALDHCTQLMRKSGFDYAFRRDETSVQ
jgi:RNA polymerase sigma factor (sigma-70 family)